MPPRRISADWVLPVAGPPIRNGAVLVGNDGRILALGPSSADALSSDGPAEHFSGAAILPGLVNAHTHLELTGFDNRVPEGDFPEWIRTIRALKAERSPEEFLDAARAGLRAFHASGVTTIADTGDSGAAIRALHEAGGSGIAYLEVFGPHPSDAGRQMEDFRVRVDRCRPFASERVRLGLSPHAPYSVSGPLYTAVARRARAEGLPLAVHIAESPAEVQLLDEASGPFAEMWRARGIPLPSGGRSPLQWLEEHDVLGADTLCIHVVQVDSIDIARLQRHDCAVALCPRSNQRHGHGTAPLTDLLEAGLRLGVGTDSVASVSPPDLLAEARVARALAGLTAERALLLCTLDAARAIGLEPEVGSLTIGKWGDLAVHRLPSGVDEPALLDTVLSLGPGDVAVTYLGGREVYRANHPSAASP